VASCEHSNELSGSIKGGGGEFRDYELLKKDSDPCSYYDHVTQMAEINATVFWWGYVFKQSFGRRWVDNITMDLREIRCDVRWIELAHDHIQWRC
jgi:hypothetical protein